MEYPGNYSSTSITGDGGTSTKPVESTTLVYPYPPYQGPQKYLLSMVVMTIFIMMLGMLLYYTIRWWYPDDFGCDFARRRRSANRVSSLSMVSLVSQDKPPTYDEIMKDNMSGLPSYDEALQQFAELRYLSNDERLGYLYQLPPPYRRPTVISDTDSVTMSRCSDGWAPSASASSSSRVSISVIIIEEATRL